MDQYCFILIDLYFFIVNIHAFVGKGGFYRLHMKIQDCEDKGDLCRSDLASSMHNLPSNHGVRVNPFLSIFFIHE